MNFIEPVSIESKKDLICPITLQLFRDPVLASDSHVYERSAIQRWILEHGTSPLTREPLRTADLKPVEHLRCLAAKERMSIVSYSVHDEIVIFPPRQQNTSNHDQIHIILQQSTIQNHNCFHRCSRYCTPSVFLMHTGVLIIFFIIICIAIAKHI